MTNKVPRSPAVKKFVTKVNADPRYRTRFKTFMQKINTDHDYRNQFFEAKDRVGFFEKETHIRVSDTQKIEMEKEIARLINKIHDQAAQKRLRLINKMHDQAAQKKPINGNDYIPKRVSIVM